MERARKCKYLTHPAIPDKFPNRIRDKISFNVAQWEIANLQEFKESLHRIGISVYEFESI